MRSLTLISALVAGPAVADEANLVRVHETFLDAPTAWCAPDAGIPVVMYIDGPDLFVGVPLGQQANEVKVRRGGDAVERVEVGRKDPTALITRYGTEGIRSSESTTSINIAPDSVSRAGRLQAEVRMCHSHWVNGQSQMSWRVVAADGSIAAKGDDGPTWYYPTGVFNTFRPYPQALKLGDITFVMMAEPTFERTTEAFASPAEETQQ